MFGKRRRKRLEASFGDHIDRLVHGARQLADVLFNVVAGEADPSKDQLDGAIKKLFDDFEREFKDRLCAQRFDRDVVENLASLGMAKARLAFQDRWRELRAACRGNHGRAAH
jgi:hypothetical protein